MQTISPDRKLVVFHVEDPGATLPCILCGEKPKDGEKVVERTTGEPALLCSRFVQSALTGFEDLDHLASGYIHLVGL